MTLYVDGVRVGHRADGRTGGAFDGYWRVGGDTLSQWTNRPSTRLLQRARSTTSRSTATR